MADFSEKQILSFHIKLELFVESKVVNNSFRYTHTKICWCTVGFAEGGGDPEVENRNTYVFDIFNL